MSAAIQSLKVSSSNAIVTLNDFTVNKVLDPTSTTIVHSVKTAQRNIPALVATICVAYPLQYVLRRRYAALTFYRRNEQSPHGGSQANARRLNNGGTTAAGQQSSRAYLHNPDVEQDSEWTPVVFGSGDCGAGEARTDGGVCPVGARPVTPGASPSAATSAGATPAQKSLTYDDLIADDITSFALAFGVDPTTDGDLLNAVRDILSTPMPATIALRRSYCGLRFYDARTDTLSLSHEAVDAKAEALRDAAKLRHCRMTSLAPRQSEFEDDDDEPAAPVDWRVSTIDGDKIFAHFLQQADDPSATFDQKSDAAFAAQRSPPGAWSPPPNAGSSRGGIAGDAGPDGTMSGLVSSMRGAVTAVLSRVSSSSPIHTQNSRGQTPRSGKAPGSGTPMSTPRPGMTSPTVRHSRSASGGLPPLAPATPRGEAAKPAEAPPAVDDMKAEAEAPAGSSGVQSPTVPKTDREFLATVRAGHAMQVDEKI